MQIFDYVDRERLMQQITDGMVKEMNAAMNQVREVFEFSMSLPLDWMLQRPIGPRSIIQGMDGV
jgi:hypothetical protein